MQEFGDTREIVLLQLCTCRTARMLSMRTKSLGGRSDHDKWWTNWPRVCRGRERSVRDHSLDFGVAHVVVACNTAHNFVPEAFNEYQQRSPNGQLKVNSMVECVTAELKKSKGQGSPRAHPRHQRHTQDKLYIDPLEKAGVKCAVPDETGQKFLTDAIYKGVKLSSPKRPVKNGEALFLRID